MTEVDYFQASGANIFVYFNDGTMLQASLVVDTLVVYHPNAPAGVWNTAFIDAVDHNVYLTGTKTGVLGTSSTSRLVSSADRQASSNACIVTVAGGTLLGAFIGWIAGEDLGAIIGAGIGILVGPEGAVFGAIIGGVVGIRTGSLVGATLGQAVAQWFCDHFIDKNPPNPPNTPPGTGGGNYGVPPDSSSDNCWTDPVPPNCYRRQAPVPL